MPHAFAAEVMKLRTTRTTMWMLTLALWISTGMGYLIGMTWNQSGSAENMTGSEAIFISFAPLTLAQLALVSFAVVAVGNEFSTGTIAVSLTAVPHRVRFFTAKLAAGALVLLVVVPVIILAGFFAVQAGVGEHAVGLACGDVPGSVLGAWGYLVLLGVFAMGTAAALRGSAAALGVLLPLLLLNSQGLGNLPKIKEVAQYLPDQAGMTLMGMTPGTGRFSHDYGIGGALAILVTWAVVACLAGCLVTRYREP